jgi:hypothetical protein
MFRSIACVGPELWPTSEHQAFGGHDLCSIGNVEPALDLGSGSPVSGQPAVPTASHLARWNLNKLPKLIFSSPRSIRRCRFSAVRGHGEFFYDHFPPHEVRPARPRLSEVFHLPRV